MAPQAPAIECKKLQPRGRKNNYSQIPWKSFEPNNFHMILRSHGKRRETSITILPEEIIFNILIWLPAEVLYNVVRYVCRQWHKIIDDHRFVSSHLMLSTSSLLLYCRNTWLYYHMDVSEGDVKLTDFKFDLSCYMPMLSTCNGLMMLSRLSGYYIGNPITRRIMALPPISSPIISYICGLAFEASSKVYKVVVIYDQRINSSRSFGHLGCGILTVGVDKAWRVLNCTHLNEDDKRFLVGSPFTGAGFMFWISYSKLYILVLDLESESIKRISLPFAYGSKKYFLPKGQSITFWQANSDFSMEVWLLKDHRTEEWVKFLYIDSEIRNELEKILSRNKVNPCPEYIYPISWLGKGERILLRTNSKFNEYFVYDLKTRGCRKVGTKNDCSYRLVPFVNSLAWVRGCY